MGSIRSMFSPIGIAVSTIVDSFWPLLTNDKGLLGCMSIENRPVAGLTRY